MPSAMDIQSSKSATRMRSEVEVSDESIQRSVSQIRQICRDSSLEFALRVGGVVIHNFYDGEVEAWRMRGPKLHSFRRLSAHPDLPMSPAALYRCVAIFELCERLNAPSRWRRLGPSHFRSVLGLPPDEQEKLLAKANADHWTVQTLQAAATRRRNEESRRGGRKPMSTLVKNLTAIYRALEHCQSDLEGCETRKGDSRLLEHDELEKAATMIARTREWLDHVARMVQQHHEGVTASIPDRASSRRLP